MIATKRRTTKARQYAEVQRLNILGAEWDTGPFGLIHYASDFVKVAEDAAVPQAFAPVRYFLACHAIELGLKAYLALQGRPVAELVDAYGHRLTPALDDAVKQGLLNMVPGLTAAMQTEIRNASEKYNDKVFEYPALMVMVTGFRDRPDVDVLIKAARALVDALHAPCLQYGDAVSKGPAVSITQAPASGPPGSP